MSKCPSAKCHKVSFSKAKMTVFSIKKLLFANEVPRYSTGIKLVRQVGEPILTTPHFFRYMGIRNIMDSKVLFTKIPNADVFLRNCQGSANGPH